LAPAADALLAVGDFGRVTRVRAGGAVDVVVGIDRGAAAGDLGGDDLGEPALTMPVLARVGGVAVGDGRIVIAGDDAVGPVVVVLDAADLAEPSSWTIEGVASAVDLVELAGVSYDEENDRFLVVDAGAACVRALKNDLVIDAASVAGVCGEPDRFGAFLFKPTAAVARGGDVYVTDTGNHRVVRYTAPDAAEPIIGDGTPSVAGAGAPAREFAIAAPRQLGGVRGPQWFRACRL